MATVRENLIAAKARITRHSALMIIDALRAVVAGDALFSAEYKALVRATGGADGLMTFASMHTTDDVLALFDRAIAQDGAA